mgnify:CR=1 FL=1
MQAKIDRMLPGHSIPEKLMNLLLLSAKLCIKNEIDKGLKKMFEFCEGIANELKEFMASITVKLTRSSAKSR